MSLLELLLFLIFLDCIVLGVILVYVFFLVVVYGCVIVGYDLGVFCVMFEKLFDYVKRVIWVY